MEDKIILHGDGVHDDSDALQAWMDRKPVFYSSGEPVGDHLRDLTFKLSRIIKDDGIRDKQSSMRQCNITGDWGGGMPLPIKPVIEVDTVKNQVTVF